MGRKTHCGFTVLELLIVVGIVSILLSIATASYTAAQKRARDGQRKSHLKDLQNAFEQYYADNSNTYPSAASSLVPTYVPAGLPTDPKTKAPYAYSYPGGGYCVCAMMEGGASEGNARDAACTFGSGGYYCVKNIQ